MSCTFTSRIAVGHAKDILARDRARAKKFLAGLHPHGPLPLHEFRRRSHQHHPHSTTGGSGTAVPQPDPEAGAKSIDVTDAAVTYTASVKVGTQTFNLLIDTGSSNTFVGAGTEYKPGSTSKNLRKTASVSYGSGSFTGTAYQDTVTLGDIAIQNQIIAVTTPQKAQGFSDVDGILGIGPVDLTTGTVEGLSSVPTVTDNMLAEKIIDVETIGIFYAPTTSQQSIANGELTFGSVDDSKVTGTVNYVPITSTSPASKYWGIDQSMTYGGQTIMSGSAGIVDTGTTLLMLPTDTFQQYQQATGAQMDNSTGLLTVTEDQFNSMQDLVFNVGGQEYSLTPNAQIWPRSLNSTLGGDASKIYLVVADMGQESGQGLDFIDGFAFLQRFYSVYDTTNSRVGFAETEFTNATTN